MIPPILYSDAHYHKEGIECMRILLTSMLLFEFWLVTIYGQVVVQQKPEKPFENVKKPEKPGTCYFWISAHWKWDKEKREYVWVKGFWQKKRKGFKYIPGHWRQVVGGWIWIPGEWRKRSEKGRSVFVKYPRMKKISLQLKEPALKIQPGIVREIPRKPITQRKKPDCPGEKYFWINGSWLWDDMNNEYTWRNGRWAKKRSGFQYMPGRWIKVGNGWKWHEGHWVRKR